MQNILNNPGIMAQIHQIIQISANIQRTNEETSTFGNQQNIGMNCYSIKQPTCENLISMTVILGWVVPEIRMYDFSLPFMCNCFTIFVFV